MALRICHWDEHFENNRTRELKKLSWVPIPNKHDSDGFTDLMSRRNSMAVYGAWVLILEVASKCDPRGTLLRDGKKPHDSASLARITHGHIETFSMAIPILVEIGWLEIIADPVSTCINTAPSCGITAPSCVQVAPSCIEGKGMEGNGRELITDSSALETAQATEPNEPPVLIFPTVGREKEWHLTARFCEELKSAYPQTDVQAEARKALTWVKTNSRKTANGMPKFLNSWMGRAANYGASGGRSNGNGTANPVPRPGFRGSTFDDEFAKLEARAITIPARVEGPATSS